MPTIDELLDYYDSIAESVPDAILDIADDIFNITDDDDIPEEYYVWVARQVWRMKRSNQL